MYHEWAEPQTVGTFCVHCGKSPLAVSVWDKCPEYGSNRFWDKAYERWRHMIEHFSVKQIKKGERRYQELKNYVSGSN